MSYIWENMDRYFKWKFALIWGRHSALFSVTLFFLPRNVCNGLKFEISVGKKEISVKEIVSQRISVSLFTTDFMHRSSCESDFGIVEIEKHLSFNFFSGIPCW